MEYKWFGAILVIGGCGGFGFAVAGETLRREKLLRQMLENLDFMESEIRYRLTALPELFQLCALRSGGTLRRLFLDLAGELDKHTAPRVETCLRAALDRQPGIPARVRGIVYQLGNPWAALTCLGSSRESRPRRRAASGNCGIWSGTGSSG